MSFTIDLDMAWMYDIESLYNWKYCLQFFIKNFLTIWFEETSIISGFQDKYMEFEFERTAGNYIHFIYLN